MKGFKRNQAGDGWMPCCGHCEVTFDDGDIGEVKNYPEDGRVAVFFKCERCGYETEFIGKLLEQSRSTEP